MRERRLARFAHWDEIQVRLQHRWPVQRVLAWHQKKWPNDPHPAKMTLFRYIKSKAPGWFVSRLVLAESGTETAHNQLVAERQSELIESLVMRLQVARTFDSLDHLNLDVMPEYHPM